MSQSSGYFIEVMDDGERPSPPNPLSRFAGEGEPSRHAPSFVVGADRRVCPPARMGRVRSDSVHQSARRISSLPLFGRGAVVEGEIRPTGTAIVDETGTRSRRVGMVRGWTRLPLSLRRIRWRDLAGEKPR